MGVRHAKFYSYKWWMFDNFAAIRVKYDGVDYMTAEHAYHAAKFPKSNEAVRAKIRKARSALEAKHIAREFEKRYLRASWHKDKLAVMEAILRAKLAQHDFVREALIAAKGMYIVEDSPRDSFWGRGPDRKGENNLGKLWMKLRDELLEKE